jgi:hypothetical protein
VPRRWIYGSLGVLGLLALLVAAFSVWMILHAGSPASAH